MESFLNADVARLEQFHRCRRGVNQYRRYFHPCSSAPPRPLFLIASPLLQAIYLTLLGFYSKGFVRVPHQTKNKLSPTVSKTRAKAPTATVSKGLFSVETWAMNYTSQYAE